MLPYSFRNSRVVWGRGGWSGNKVIAMDFQECLSTCGSVRTQFSRLFYGVPESFSFASDGRSVIFLSSARGGGNALYSVRWAWSWVVITPQLQQPKS